MNTWKAILAALVIFGAGLVGGTILSKVSEPRTGTIRSSSVRPAQALPLEHLRRLEMMSRVEKELSLTPDQREHIEKIIGDGQDHVRELWDEVAPDINDELADVRQKLYDELTPAQRQRFNELMRQHSKRPAGAGTNPVPAKVEK